MLSPNHNRKMSTRKSNALLSFFFKFFLEKFSHLFTIFWFRFEEEIQLQARKIKDLERIVKESEDEVKNAESELEQLEEKYAKVTRSLKKYQREYQKIKSLQKAGDSR